MNLSLEQTTALIFVGLLAFSFVLALALCRAADKPMPPPPALADRLRAASEWDAEVRR